MQYESQFIIGQEVKLVIGEYTTLAYVRAIIFTNSKVRYSLFIERLRTTFHNIDSIYVVAVENPNFTDFGDDNYS